MRQIHWSPKPTNRETNKSTTIKPVQFKTNSYKSTTINAFLIVVLYFSKVIKKKNSNILHRLWP